MAKVKELPWYDMPTQMLQHYVLRNFRGRSLVWLLAFYLGSYAVT